MFKETLTVVMTHFKIYLTFMKVLAVLLHYYFPQFILDVSTIALRIVR